MINLAITVLSLLACAPAGSQAAPADATASDACDQAASLPAPSGGAIAPAGQALIPVPADAAPTESPSDAALQSATPGHPQDSAQPDIVVKAKSAPPPGDPLESVNLKSFQMTQDVDKAVIRPMALAFAKTVPGPLRAGLGNALANLREPVVFLNYLLQHNIGKAAETVARFVVNSTLGVAGLVDIARRKPFKLPRRPNGLANTLGFYGVHAGPFLFAPLVGPITLRDLIGGVVDRLVVPTFFGRPFNRLYFTVPAGAFSELDHRAAFDDQLEMLHQDPTSPYAATRAFYLKRREAEIEALHTRRRKAGDAAPPAPPADGTGAAPSSATETAPTAATPPVDKVPHATQPLDTAQLAASATDTAPPAAPAPPPVDKARTAAAPVNAAPTAAPATGTAWPAAAKLPVDKAPPAAPAQPVDKAAQPTP